LLEHVFFTSVNYFFPTSEFGAKVVPPKKILKMLPELFDHPDQNVRASSKGLTLELCRWIGKEPVKSILFEKMRDTMVGLFVPVQCFY
jgi:cytoskeleton-associated protein 5